MKRMKLALWGIIMSHLLLANEQPQLPNTIWQNNTEKYIYLYYYSQKKLYGITDYTRSKYPEFGIEVSNSFYGFYNDCDLPSIDSLKRNGDYYFDVIPFYFKYEEKRKVYVENACGEVSIFTEKQDTFMNIYYSSRQQYVTYKKLDTLPQNVQKYLIGKGIHVGFPHKEISSNRATIYSEPEKPTRMYLIKGDIVTVLEEKEGWLRIEYEGKKLVTGWIQKKDIGGE
jgi:hypothetical protein